MQGSAENRRLEMTTRNSGASSTIRKQIPLDERELLLRHRLGDSDAFAELVAGYRRPVYSYLVRCGVAETDRDDLFQDIFIKIHRAAAQYQDDRPLHPWLFTIVANTVRTYYRKKKVREMVFAEASELEPQAATADGERLAMARQTAAWLEQEIQKLPLAQQEVLILTRIESLPQKDVAEALNLPIGTVKTNLRRARLALIARLARHNAIKHGEVRS